MRMPCSVWGIFVASIMGLLAFPALFVASIMMLLDRVIGTSFFLPSIVSMGQQLPYSGGSPILFQHLFWLFGHPEVYIVALPALTAEQIKAHARENLTGYKQPRYVEFRDELPKSNVGKILRRELREESPAKAG